MKHALIINTSCLDPFVMGQKNPHRKQLYAQRDAMVQQIVASAQQFDEIIIAGVYRPGEDYLYVPVSPERRNRSDALMQREVGARYSTSDTLTFCHDDHMPAEDYLSHLPADWDLIVPKRIHKATNETLNNGLDDAYMGGHCLTMRRWLWARVPWTSTEMTYWDITMTRIWKEAGASILYSDLMIHYDLEAAEDEL